MFEKVSRRARGIAPIVGVVLIIGISLATITAILFIGTGVLDQAQADSHTAQMENSMAQMASKASLVALGESPGQTFHLGQTGGGDLRVDPDAGTVRVLYTPANESEIVIIDKPLGAVSYTHGGTEIAFQGGGVWKNHETGTTMLSPPEYHYQGETLTFPIIRIEGTGTTGGLQSGQISKSTETVPIYPNPEVNDFLINPVEEGKVYVEITSNYHFGWHGFFDQRTDGAVEHDIENQSVLVDLTVPFEAEWDSPIALKSDGQPDVSGGAANNPPDYLEEIQLGMTGYPSATTKVADGIAHCENNPSQCDPFGEESEYSGDATYYTNETVTVNNPITFDTTDGDITVVIDGDFTVQDDITVSGDGNVTVLQRGSLDVRGGGAINEDRSSVHFRMYYHSDSEMIEFGGSAVIHALVYAPNTPANIDGSPSGFGSFIFEELGDAGGPATEFVYDENAAALPLDVDGDADLLHYLHISENAIIIEPAR